MPGFFRTVSNRFFKFYKRQGIVGKIVTLLATAAGVVVTAVLALVFFVWTGLFGKLPDKDDLKEIQNPIASEVYSADSVLLGKYYLENRSPISPADLPENLKHALIATEDVRFYEHHGIDVRSLFRVLVKSILLQDEGSGGGSTLTQQLAKNLFPRKSYAFLSMPINKIREFIVAWRMENVYTKDEITLLYLNTIPFSDNTYGIKTAAERFFTKPVKDLDVNESAVLVGMLKATHSYNPRLFPERSKQRRDVVISQMEKYDFISEQESKSFQKLPLGLEYGKTTAASGVAAYFRAHLERELVEWCKRNKKENGSPYNLYADGLRIYTTIDSRMQRYAEQGMQAQMKELQKRFQQQLNKREVEEIALSKLKALPQYKTLAATGLSEKEVLRRLKAPVKTSVFSWEGDKQIELSVFDSIKHQMSFLQAGVLAMDPHTGGIKVWVGGIDHQFFPYDHVKETTKRQVGSTLKPLIYAAALESGIGPCDYISARKTSYTNMDGWTPENTNEETYEKKYSMEGGLAGSVNTVSIKLLEKTGIHNTISHLRKVGITSELPAVPSLALGTPSISMMEMVGAYGVLANDGIYTEPIYLTSVTDRKGKTLERFEPEHEPEQVLSEESSDMIVHMLKTVISEGTGSSLHSSYGVTNDIAGKTGTTQSNVDGWFIAMMPKLVIGAWVGSDDPRLHFRSTALGQGAATALPVVARFFQQANKDKALRPVMNARFEPLSEELLEALDCKKSKSNTNFFQRLFKKKKGTKVTKFKGAKDKNS